ncbi:MAG: hypothetical protein AAF663_08870 [Planctomycetota bacterium]
MKRFSGLGLAATLTSGAAGQVTAFDVEHIVSDDGGRVANVLSIDYEGLYRGTQMVVELTQGAMIFERAFGEDIEVAPHSGLVALAPDLAYATYAAQGGRFSDDGIGPPNLGGAAVNILPGDFEARWRQPRRLSRAWNPAATMLPFQAEAFVVAQLGLTADAQGEIVLIASAEDDYFQTGMDTVAYRIANGKVVPVPEPGMVGALGVLGWLGLRRR